LRAGHPVPIAISMVAREMRDPIGSEFGIVTDEITYGADLETALRNLYVRLGQEDLPLFVTAVAVAMLLAGGALTTRSDAMTPRAPAGIHTTSKSTAAVAKVRMVRHHGRWGRHHHHRHFSMSGHNHRYCR